MDTHLGRTAVVTGAAAGIGRAVSCELIRRGADIIAIDLDPADDTADAVRQLGRKVLPLQADVSDPRQVEALAGDLLNAVCPTATRTPGMQHVGEERLQAIANLQAIKRIGTPEDVVGAVCFLTSDDCAFMTGQTVVPDGGLMRV